MELLQRIWQENKKFILRAGGGLAVFLVLNSWLIPAIVGDPRDIQKRNGDAEKAVTKVRNEVVARYGEEKNNLKELAAVEKDLTTRWLLARPQDVPDPSRGDPLTQFVDRIGSLWSAVKGKADQRNVRIPEKITTNDLGVSKGSAPEDLERSTSYLDILGRAMKSCVDQGMTSIEKPVISQEDDLPVPGTDDTLMVYRRVGLTVTGPYDAYKGVLKEFQRPGSPVQVRLLFLDTKSAGGMGLRGTLEFAGTYLETQGEPPPEVKKEASPPDKGKKSRVKSTRGKR